MAQTTWQPIQSNYVAPRITPIQVDSSAFQYNPVINKQSELATTTTNNNSNSNFATALLERMNQLQKVLADSQFLGNQNLSVQNPNTPVSNTLGGVGQVKYRQDLFNQYAPMIVNKAIQNGIDPNMLLALTYNESRFDPNAHNKRYGGLGAIDMQQHSQWSNPEYNIDQVIAMNKTNQRSLKKMGINDWNAGIAYLTHQQGVGGTTTLLRNPTLSAAEALQKTAQWKDKSVNWINKNIIERNGGKASMSAQEFANLWINKTQGYANQFAKIGNNFGGWAQFAKVKFKN